MIDKKEINFSKIGELVDNALGNSNDLLEQYITTQRDLISIFQDSDITEQLVKIIEESKCVKFYSTRSKNALDNDKPVFRLKVDVIKGKEEYPELFTDADFFDDFISRIVQKEIISNFTTIIFNSLKAHWDKGQKNISSDLAILVSSIFGLAIEKDEKKNPSSKLCTLRLMI